MCLQTAYIGAYFVAKRLIAGAAARAAAGERAATVASPSVGASTTCTVGTAVAPQQPTPSRPVRVAPEAWFNGSASLSGARSAAALAAARAQAAADEQHRQWGDAPHMITHAGATIMHVWLLMRAGGR
jgi:hypothetical protein